jgi:hypothetical protein
MDIQSIREQVNQTLKDMAASFARTIEALTEIEESKMSHLVLAIRLHSDKQGYNLADFTDEEIERAATGAWFLNPGLTDAGKNEVVRAVYRQLTAKGVYQ